MKQMRDGGWGVSARRLAVAPCACTPRSFHAVGYPMQSISRILLLALLLGISISSYACSCIGAAGVDAVDLMFTGKVVRIESTDSNLVVTFKVKHLYKGEAQSERHVLIQTKRSGQACGIHFIRHIKYAVYAFADREYASTSLCTQTRIMAPFRLWPFKPKKSSGW